MIFIKVMKYWRPEQRRQFWVFFSHRLLHLSKDFSDMRLVTTGGLLREINVCPMLMCMQIYICDRQTDVKTAVWGAWGKPCAWGCLWGRPWHMRLAITMAGNMGALQALQWRRCGKRRAKINESLYYKMPKCGAQSMCVLSKRGVAGGSSNSSSNSNNKIERKKKRVGQWRQLMLLWL